MTAAALRAIVNQNNTGELDSQTVIVPPAREVCEDRPIDISTRREQRNPPENMSAANAYDFAASRFSLSHVTGLTESAKRAPTRLAQMVAKTSQPPPYTSNKVILAKDAVAISSPRTSHHDPA
jgi:hypothetical protein